MNTKPQLEIYADDVKCQHGSSVGRIDEDALFYMCTRGVNRALAKGLLVRAFAHEALAGLPIPELVDPLLSSLEIESISGD